MSENQKNKDAYNEMKTTLTPGYWSLFVDGKFVVEAKNQNDLRPLIEKQKQCLVAHDNVVTYEDNTPAISSGTYNLQETHTKLHGTFGNAISYGKGSSAVANGTFNF